MFNRLVPLIATACLAGHAVIASAQEDLRPPSAPLQHPGEPGAAPDGKLGMLGLRIAIEKAADETLCEVLMTADGHSFPDGFDWDDDCTSAYRSKLVNGEGKAHWRNQESRPTRCGSACLGRPFLGATRNYDQPNLREAIVYGHLDFTGSEYGISRDLTYGYTVHMQCKAINGARTGDMVVTVAVGPPVIDDPGVLESVLDFFLMPANISRRVEARIRSQLASVGDITHVEPKLCRSLGVDLGTRPETDGVLFDTAPRPPSVVRPRPEAVAGIRADRVKVEFLSLTRKPLPAIASPGLAEPGSFAARQFRAYLNGVAVVLPPPLGDFDGLDLPPAGGTVSLNYCRTIPVDGWDGLQLLFVNDLGGAVWSQFPRSARFGAGQPRRMTTMRTVGVPAGTFGDKPGSIDLREFELLYRITWLPAAGMTDGGTVAPRGPGRRPGGAVTAMPGRREAIRDPGGKPAMPCREI